jgi:phosphoribosylaminoimidazolecarboxamide formyltransferase/IMP cyclohydrolase
MPRRALLSVSDTTGLTAFARGLQAAGFTLLATTGTRDFLARQGLAATAVEEVTGLPPCFGGRIKTLHPLIAGGILLRRDRPEDLAEAATLGIEPIDVVCVNLYPFSEKPDIETMDIGGPTMLRSAAKNHAHVTALCDPADYDRVLAELQHGDMSPLLRRELAAKVFLHTAAYDAAITEWLSDGRNAGVLLSDGILLRYGENPHQWGRYFACLDADLGWEKVQGKEISYLNILDADAAWTAVRDFHDPTAVFVKHANPSGIASNATIEDAFQRAYDADRLSAFGVIIALNRPCTEAIARKIVDQKMFVEVIIAESYDSEAETLLQQKPNIRVLRCPRSTAKRGAASYRSALGGMLVQEEDARVVAEEDLTVVTKAVPTRAQVEDLLFAWRCVKHAKSNAIVFAKDACTVGIGAGQTSRVDATWIAARRAGEKARGAVMASDAFFPFPDSVEEAASHGIAAIIQPGGSMRDREVFAAADRLGIAMVTTGVRAFRH